MEKPCCCEFYHLGRKEQCPCPLHNCAMASKTLPKEKCWCACHEEGIKGCVLCKCSLSKQTPAPEKEAGKGYCIECDLETQPQMLCKCPFRAEKKWEARLYQEYATKGGLDFISAKDLEKLRAFIRQILEEKAVEVEGLKKKPKCNRLGGCGLPFIQGAECYDGALCEDVSAESERNAALAEAAAILRR